MGNVVNLSFGRVSKGKKLPKPVECKECGEPVETARLQALGLNDGVLRATRCVDCERSWERRFKREMEAVRDYQTVQIIR